MRNDENDSGELADLTPGADAAAITRSLNRVVNKLTVANTRLIAIQGAIPPGPPCTPEQSLALRSTLTQSSQLTATVNAIFVTNPPPGPGPVSQ